MNFLRVRFTLDISKLLTHGSTLKSEGKNGYLTFVIGVAILYMGNVIAKYGYEVKRICEGMIGNMVSG